MAKDYTSIDEIDLDIQKLKEKRKLLQEKQEQDVGKYLLKSWGISTLKTKEILKLIDNNKPNFSSNNLNSATNNTNNI